MRLRNIFPRTLFNRLLIIILFPLLIVQLLTITVFYVRHWNTVTRHMSQNLISELSLIIDQIENYESPIDAEIIKMASKLNLILEWSPNEKLLTSTISSNTYAELAVKNAINEQIALPFSTKFLDDPDNIKIAIQYKGGIIEFICDKKRVFSSTSWIFVSWSIASSIMLFALTLIFIGVQVRPIKRLAKTAYSLGLGREIDNIPITGSTEVRLATRAMVSMASRIRRQLSDRTYMLAGVSHDLRTPLTRLRLQLAIFPKSQEIMSMSKDIEEMENMIKGYLSFAKGEEPEKIQLVNVVEEINSIIKDFQKSKVKNISLKHKNIFSKIHLKPRSFRRAIENIISNAIRYASNCVIFLEIVEENIIINIDDDGPGIPVKERQNALRPFHRLETSRNKETGGTGLGLAIATNIVHIHGGNLELLESPLNGLRVRLIIPI